MKIVNICLVAYIDGWGYQDNLLPEYEKTAGHEVVVIASANHFPSYIDKETKETIQKKGHDYYYNGVHIYRINNYINTSNLTFICTGIYSILKKEKPDIIFHHGINSSSLHICSLYKALNKNIKIYVDNHADYINESKNKLWNRLIIGGWLKITTGLIQKNIDAFLGVTPARCIYLNERFGIQKDNIFLLPIGCDSKNFDSISQSISDIKKDFGIPSNSFIISSGGKMGKDKGTIELIKAFNAIRKDNYYLILYGKFTDKESEELSKDSQNIIYAGWCDRTKTLKILKMSNIAIWPIHHTTLIEDAIAASTPLIIRKTMNTIHLIDGNGEFIHQGTQEEIISAINKLTSNYKKYTIKATEIRNKIDYKNIVNQIISANFGTWCY